LLSRNDPEEAPLKEALGEQLKTARTQMAGVQNPQQMIDKAMV
jgi:hypothetical protein